jgi:hypothetical protein
MVLTSKEIEMLDLYRNNYGKAQIRQIKAIYEKHTGKKLPCPTCSITNRKVIHATVYSWYDEARA